MVVVGFFVALAAAFWRRSWLWGLAVLNAGTLLKVIWSVAFGGAAGWASLVPSVFTLVVTDAVILLAVRFFRRRRERQEGTRHRNGPMTLGRRPFPGPERDAALGRESRRGGKVEGER